MGVESSARECFRATALFKGGALPHFEAGGFVVKPRDDGMVAKRRGHGTPVHQFISYPPGTPERYEGLPSVAADVSFESFCTSLEELRAAA